MNKISLKKLEVQSFITAQSNQKLVGGISQRTSIDDIPFSVVDCSDSACDSQVCSGVWGCN